jgi:hypothetical protein
MESRMAETPNPEKRSNGAMWCMAVGAGLLILSYILGIPSVIATAASNGDVVALAGGVTGLVVVIAAAIIGGLLTAVGAVWSLVQVVVDSRDENARERYKDVER